MYSMGSEPGLGDPPEGRLLRSFVGSRMSSDFADGLVLIGLPLVALTYSDDPWALVAMSLAVRLPWLLVTLPAGALVDRFPPFTILRIFTLLRLPLTASLLILSATGRLDFLTLMIAAFTLQCCGNVADLASQAVVPSLVGRPAVPKINKWMQTTKIILGQFAAPVAAGVLVSWGIVQSALVLTAVVLIAGILLVRQSGVPNENLESVPGTTQRAASLWSGARYFWIRQDLRHLALTASANNFAFSMMLTVLPLWVIAPGQLGLGDIGYGLVLSSLAVGSLIGSAAMSKVGAGALRRVLRLGPPLIGALYVLIAVPSPIVLSSALFLIGIIVVIWNVASNSRRHLTVPEQLMGRVNAAYRFTSWGAIPVGAIVAGVLASTCGLWSVFVVAGAAPIVMGMIILARDRDPLPPMKGTMK